MPWQKWHYTQFLANDDNTISRVNATNLAPYIHNNSLTGFIGFKESTYAPKKCVSASTVILGGGNGATVILM